MIGVKELSVLYGAKMALPTQPMHRLIEETVANSPEAPAIKTRDKMITFREFNATANRLARALIRKIGPITKSRDHLPVGVLMEPSERRLVAIIAVLKAGCAHMPLSTASPASRTRLICDLAEPLAVIVDEALPSNDHHLDSVKYLTFEELLWDNLTDGNLTDEEAFRKIGVNDLHSLYFTSGTTGIPKGVPLTHLNMVNEANWLTAQYPLQRGDMTVIMNNPQSVASSDEMYTPLLTGTCGVVLEEQQKKNPETLVRALEQHNVTRLAFCPVTLLQNVLLYLRLDGGMGRCKSLRFANIGGEAVTKQLVNDWLNYFGNRATLVNTWGMTETANDATWEPFVAGCPLDEQIIDDKVSVGKPIANVNAYIVDGSFRPVSHGEIGELAISGACVLPGYLNTPRSDAIRENTIFEDPYHKTLLMTGDYARIVNNRIIFEGRRDTQVKIRGFRINTVEVENNIVELLPDVKRTCVLGVEGSDKQMALVCFYETIQKRTVLPKEVKYTLTSNIPDYMVPSKIYYIENLPIKPPLEKVDLLKLKQIYRDKLNEEMLEGSQALSSLDSETRDLLEVVSGVLQIPPIKLHGDINLFEIGGNSVNAVNIWSKLQERGYKLSIGDLMTSKTLSDISTSMKNNQPKDRLYFLEGLGTEFEIVKLHDQPDAKDVLHIMGYSFSKENDLFKAIGCTYEQFYQITEKYFWELSKACNWSMAVRDLRDGRIVAASITYDDEHHKQVDLEPMLEEFPNFIPLLTMMAEFEELFPEHLKNHPGRTLWSWLFGTVEDLEPELKLKYMQVIFWKERLEAHKAGIRYHWAENQNPATIAEGNDMGYVTMKQIQLNRWQMEDGSRPFSCLPDYYACAVQYLDMDLHPPEHV